MGFGFDRFFLRLMLKEMCKTELNFARDVSLTALALFWMKGFLFFMFLEREGAG